MAFFFVPAGVSIINYFDVLQSAWLQLVAVCVISTVVTLRCDSLECEADGPAFEPIKRKEKRAMNEIFASPYFGVSLSVIAFGIGVLN